MDGEVSVVLCSSQHCLTDRRPFPADLTPSIRVRRKRAPPVLTSLLPKAQHGFPAKHHLPHHQLSADGSL